MLLLTGPHFTIQVDLGVFDDQEGSVAARPESQ
jgi:hypothetical protein